ncbi:hypothetical protein [Siphonobacter sp. BAB-5405]|uniref:hypothetical protein n=1 Tax=Siphonobacter sp. BAB-5405 TaxID=1864825 RepID=UPI0011AF0339|nr:hypothetical protein [Siphonobacter sp. BAB-5405]
MKHSKQYLVVLHKTDELQAAKTKLSELGYEYASMDDAKKEMILSERFSDNDELTVLVIKVDDNVDAKKIFAQIESIVSEIEVIEFPAEV